MPTINVFGPTDPAARTIQSKDNVIDANEVMAAMKGVSQADITLMTALLDGQTIEGTAWDFQTIVSKAYAAKAIPGDKDGEKKLKELQKRLVALSNGKEKLKAQKTGIETKLATKPAKAELAKLNAELKKVNDAIATVDKLIKALYEQMAASAGDKNFPQWAKEFKQNFQATHTELLGEPPAFGSGKFAATMGGGAEGAGKAAYPGGPAYPAAPGGGAFGMPGLGMGFKAAFDPSAWYASSAAMDAKLASVDQVGAEQLKSQKMLMLFFYFARLAMSGDLSAMYQFMRFIGTIVNRDKAMQNIHLAEKLIQLQADSRKATDQLLKANAYDPDDPNVSADFNKLMERTKADQGMIATDQKLIAQMLEEMSQVSEMMTGMVKSLLDARGREMNLVSVWRA